MIGDRIEFLPKNKDGDGLLPAVIAVMMFMTALALVGAVALGSGIRGWSEALDSQITIQIVNESAGTRARDTEAALRLLRATPGVEDAQILAESEVMALVAPWLGRVPTDSGLPLPTLIDVRIRPGASLDTGAIAERLAVAAPSAIVDDHEVWLSQVLELAQMVRITLGIITAMVLMCTSAIVIFGCRASLAAHADIISIMHNLGAEDSLIAGSFERRYFWHGISGGIMGVLFAALVFVTISRLSEKLGEGLLMAITPELDALWWMLALPLATAILTAFTARLTVRRVLLGLM